LETAQALDMDLIKSVLVEKRPSLVARPAILLRVVVYNSVENTCNSAVLNKMLMFI
jgi:hypothetical protein